MGCETPDDLYNHSEDWLKHMRQHIIRWRCNAKSHEVQTFESESAFKEHLRERHPKSFTESQIPLLAARSTCTTGPLFPSCPLCGATDTRNRLEDHIIGHLRFLALKSLPWLEDADDNDAEATSDSVISVPARERSTIAEAFNTHTGLPPLHFSEDNAQITKTQSDDSMEFVDDSIFSGMSTTETMFFEWGFITNLYQPHQAVLLDPILQEILYKRNVKRQNPENVNGHHLLQ